MRKKDLKALIEEIYENLLERIDLQEEVSKEQIISYLRDAVDVISNIDEDKIDSMKKTGIHTFSNNDLRSGDWFGKSDKMGFVHRSWLRNQGYPDDYFKGKPVIGICNTWSELTPCNGHLREFAEIVKRGVVEAGGFPMEFPVTATVEKGTLTAQGVIKVDRTKWGLKYGSGDFFKELAGDKIINNEFELDVKVVAKK